MQFRSSLPFFREAAPGGAAANASNVGVNDFSGSLSQQWYVVNHGNGLYSIRSNLNRSYYLDVDGGQDTNERNVQIYADSSRRFRIRWEFNTAYTSISPTFSNTKVLDVYGGEDTSRLNTNVQIYPYSRGGNQTWEFEETNDKITGDINTVHSLAKQYGYSDITAEKVVLQYLRNSHKYTTDLWTIVAGPVDQSFVQFVHSSAPQLSYLSEGVYLNDQTHGPVDLSHRAVTTNGMLFGSNTFLGRTYSKGIVNDLCGWAGDLQTLINQTVEQVGLSADYGTFRAAAFLNIGVSEAQSCFSMPDLLADMDAIYYVNHTRSGLMGDALYSYYLNTASSVRFTHFINGRSFTDMLTDVNFYTYPFDSNGSVWPLMHYSISSEQSIAIADAFVSRVRGLTQQ